MWDPYNQELKTQEHIDNNRDGRKRKRGKYTKQNGFEGWKDPKSKAFLNETVLPTALTAPNDVNKYVWDPNNQELKIKENINDDEEMEEKDIEANL